MLWIPLLLECAWGSGGFLLRLFWMDSWSQQLGSKYYSSWTANFVMWSTIYMIPLVAANKCRKPLVFMLGHSYMCCTVRSLPWMNIQSVVQRSKKLCFSWWNCWPAPRQFSRFWTWARPAYESWWTAIIPESITETWYSPNTLSLAATTRCFFWSSNHHTLVHRPFDEFHSPFSISPQLASTLPLLRHTLNRNCRHEFSGIQLTDIHINPKIFYRIHDVRTLNTKHWVSIDSCREAFFTMRDGIMVVIERHAGNTPLHHLAYWTSISVRHCIAPVEIRCNAWDARHSGSYLECEWNGQDDDSQRTGFLCFDRQSSLRLNPRTPQCGSLWEDYHKRKDHLAVVRTAIF